MTVFTAVVTPFLVDLRVLVDIRTGYLLLSEGVLNPLEPFESDGLGGEGEGVGGDGVGCPEGVGGAGWLPPILIFNYLKDLDLSSDLRVNRSLHLHC